MILYSLVKNGVCCLWMCKQFLSMFSPYSKGKHEGELDMKSIFQSFFADFPSLGEGEMLQLSYRIL